jgi:hypothetical protein
VVRRRGGSVISRWMQFGNTTSCSSVRCLTDHVSARALSMAISASGAAKVPLLTFEGGFESLDKAAVQSARERTFVLWGVIRHCQSMRPELRLGTPHPPCGAYRAAPRPQGRALVRLLGGVLLALAISSSGAAHDVRFTFNAEEIETVLEKAGELTGITFVFDPEQVHGKITILAPGKVSSEDVVDLLDSALMLHGYALVRQGSSAWVVPATQAMPTIEEAFEVVPLDYARAEELAYTLTLLAPRGLTIVPDPRTNSLVIRGDPETVNELINLIKGQASGNGDSE